jgi:phospholipid transport system transporter-binding protein
MAFAVPSHAGRFAAAADLLRQGEAAVAGGENEIDLGAVGECDSSLIACLLAWKRTAQARGAALVVSNAPANLGRIASLYGVEALALK